MSATEMALAGPEVEMVPKATRRRCTVELQRKIVQEADGMVRICFLRESPSPSAKHPLLPTSTLMLAIIRPICQ